MARDQTGKRISVKVLTSRQPASMTSPTTPHTVTEVASRSPNMPSVLSEVHATSSTSPLRHCSIATCSIQLSPGWASTVTALPAICAPGQIGRM
jgi:hypothetical protein